MMDTEPTSCPKCGRHNLSGPTYDPGPLVRLDGGRWVYRMEEGKS